VKSFREWSVAGALVAMLGVLAVVAPSFFQFQPLISLASREAPSLVVTGGMALIILSRQIDISVGSQFAVCGVAAGLMTQTLPFPVVALVTLVLGQAEVFEQVHAGRPRRAFAGQHEHLHVVAELELVQHLEHAAVELGAHAVALVGAVEADPGDSVDDIVGDGLGFGAGVGLGRLGHL
jgi:hypothetical protein